MKELNKSVVFTISQTLLRVSPIDKEPFPMGQLNSFYVIYKQLLKLESESKDCILVN